MIGVKQVVDQIETFPVKRRDEEEQQPDGETSKDQTFDLIAHPIEVSRDPEVHFRKIYRRNGWPNSQYYVETYVIDLKFVYQLKSE